MNTEVTNSETGTNLSFSKVDLGNVKPVRLPIGTVKPDPDQSRKYFDLDAIAEMAESIDGEGQKEFIEVAPPNEDGIHIIGGGENRYRAHILKEMTHIWAIIDPRLAEPLDRQLSGLTSNINRIPMIPLDIANELAKQMKARSIGIAEISRLSGIKPPAVNRYLKLTKMNQKVAVCTRPDTDERYQVSFNTALIICDNIDYHKQWAFMEELASIAEVQRRIKPNMRPGISRRLVLDNIAEFNEKHGGKQPKASTTQTAKNAGVDTSKIVRSDAEKLLTLISLAIPLGNAIENVFDSATPSTIKSFYNRLSSTERGQLSDALKETTDLHGLSDVMLEQFDNSNVPGLSTSLTDKKKSDFAKSLSLIIQLHQITKGSQ